jgi:hypothetical protein
VVRGTALRDPDRHTRHEVNRASLHRDVVKDGFEPAETDRLIDALLERGLLVEFDPYGPVEQVFRTLRLYPIAEGMGNSPDEPEWRRIGHNGKPVLQVGGLVYGIWA